ncbi:class I SAM-dependent methyltransferase [Actinomadura violacea]|uniref:Methyltransferase domain-containing protein n=1 Tax=Actinomadura violacea TaxID=2819934 RepID=A0ABS3S7H3_9ACTN|nr:class I SAM-dependent methyltransferase [Actinomadura violacea]MBO2464703.1 methyltransferase domain-containing protein [Actinomadura violacea]
MSHTPPHGHHGHQHGHGHGHHHDDEDQVEMLDLSAEILAEHIAATTAWLPVEGSPRKIVDLGCGTGAGTFALLARFPEAHVTAVDSSAEHLDRLEEKARAQGVDERVSLVRADLDADWPDLGTPDLVWASASMHHMADPNRALRKVRDLLAPGGLFAVVELAGLPNFLPDDAPQDRPGLEARLYTAADRSSAEEMPYRGADWGPMLTNAGFVVEGEQVFTANIEGSRDETVGRYALGTLRRVRAAVADELAPDDLAALDRLLDTGGPGSILHRDDLALRTERTVWAARRGG